MAHATRDRVRGVSFNVQPEGRRSCIDKRARFHGRRTEIDVNADGRIKDSRDVLWARPFGEK